MKKYLALFLTLTLAVGLFVGCSKNATPDSMPLNGDTLEEGIKGQTSYLVGELSADDKRLDQVIAVCGDYQLTNRLLQFFFWDEYLKFMSSYGSYAAYFGLDTTKPLCDQDSLAEGLNWEQFFLESALTTFHHVAAIATEAKKMGKETSDDLKEYLDSLEETLTTNATSNGFESVEAFLALYYGPSATMETAKQYSELIGFADENQEAVYAALEYTDADMEAYYHEHEDALVSNGVQMDDGGTINVRHILITWEDDDGDGTPTDEEKQAALESAEAILVEYEKNPTEEHFSELANEYSTDPGSNTNGGLYENVYPGQMVTAFNDWCFDASREYADTGIVETNYGYHIMYFVSSSDVPYWKSYILDNGFPSDFLMDSYAIGYDVAPIAIGTSQIYEETISGS